MLGDHFLATAVQANGTLKDIGGQAFYLNASNRLNWGVSLGHIPYLTGYSTFVPNGDNTFTLNQILDRIYIDELSLITQYPFSMTRRVEFSVGATRYAFDREIQRVQYNAFRQPISGLETIDTTAPDPITFVEASLAWVGDNSYFAFVSPISGKRFRFQVTPAIGTLSFTTALADYRTYTFKNPFTFATRFMHYGRYGGDANGLADDGSQILSPLFLGQEPFIRGYDRESFSGTECRPTEDAPFACPVFDRLLGSRIAIANFELRIPLLGFEQYGIINFPFLPTEISPFLDMGLAWSSGDEVNFSFERNGSERVPVFSAGLSARVNLLGFAVLESYYAYPFQRPDRGWHWGFQLYPGW
jgi:hypothetical protein